jgi:nitrite reductase (NADH) small subunit
VSVREVFEALGVPASTSVACPLHNWTIALEDGGARAPDAGCTQRFSCRVEGGQVLLDPVELATLAIEPEAPQEGPCR